MKNIVAVIGGTGLENADFFQKEEIEANTPYGKPSDKISRGEIGDTEILILPRHGKKHNINPSNVNYRANIYALKQLGATHIIGVTACGSLREHIHPGDFITIDQFIDKTTKRITTFYDADKVAHIPMHTPFCPNLRAEIIKSARFLNIPIHEKGTIVTIEGPRFSSRAESFFNRMIGGDVINMTTVPECVLAREAGICYASIAMATDYDCFMENNTVTLEKVIEQMKKNSSNAQLLLKNTIGKLSQWQCSCKEDIKNSIL